MEVVWRQQEKKRVSRTCIETLGLFLHWPLTWCLSFNLCRSAWTAAISQISNFSHLIASTLNFVPINLDLNILLQSQHFYLDNLCQRHLNLMYQDCPEDLTVKPTLNSFSPSYSMTPTFIQIHVVGVMSHLHSLPFFYTPYPQFIGVKLTSKKLESTFLYLYL